MAATPSACNRIRTIIALLVGAALLAACSPTSAQTTPTQPTPDSGPATALVTPGADATQATQTAPAVALVGTATNEIAPTFGPLVGGATASPTTGSATVTPAMLATITPIPTAAGLATPIGPTATFGSVIGPNYTPPPSLTPWPLTELPPGTLPPIVTPGPSLTPGPMLRADLMGIQIHGFVTDAEFSQMLDHAAALGVTWIKVQIDWALHEPVQGQFSREYEANVLNVQRASIRGFKTLLSFAKAPNWARPEEVRGQEAGPPADAQDLADFVSHFVRDAKPEFIDAIEIWNEPNLISEWRGQPLSGAVYMAYFRAAYDAILAEQRAQPSALKPGHRIIVITGAPAPAITSSDGTTTDDRVWIEQLYDGGVASYGPDVAIGAHPYGWANPPGALCCSAASGVTGWFEHPSFYFRETLNAYRQTMLQKGDGARKIWVTEFGWASFDGLVRSDGTPGVPGAGLGWQSLINQQQQAQYVVEAFRVAQQPPYYDFLGPMILWNLNFALVPEVIDNGRSEAGFSLLDGAGNRRPVFQSLVQAPKTLPTPSP
jgi:hypothetical protein